MPIKVVFFDVGETLVDETRLWKSWAACFGVSTNEFLRVLGETIERGDDHRRALEHFKPGLDLPAARQERESFGHPDLFDERDLYPDGQPSILSLRSAGYRVGIAGSRTMQAEEVLARIGLHVDFMASSARWGVYLTHPAGVPVWVKKVKARSRLLQENYRIGGSTRAGDHLRRRSTSFPPEKQS